MRSREAGRLLTMAGQEQKREHLDGLGTIPMAIGR